MEFRVSRSARDRYALGDRFSTRADAPHADPVAARRFAHALATAGGSRADRPVSAGDVAAMAIIHEVLHRVIEQAEGSDGALRKALEELDREVGRARADGTLAAFEADFPGRSVYAGEQAPTEVLAGRTDGTPNRVLSLQELLLLWAANQNPAFMRYGELFDDSELEDSTDYQRIVDELRQGSAGDQQGGGRDLVERLLAPARAAPDSLTDQLRWIREQWGELLDEDLQDRLTTSLDVLAEEDQAAKRAFEQATGGVGQPAVDTAALHAFEGEPEPEAFSPDQDWMPELVLLAKSTYVWLDQLSRAHGRPIRTLDAIPDEELDRLRDAGFTGLWLIGIWERSHASQRIKQLRGNPEAVASAYSLMDYRISDDLGGEPAWANLRDRAWARGIRLASDMVPNHMGIDSRWVMEHADWFIGRDDSPFPAYSFTGPNLSSDERVGIYLEDHYADGSDAAVVFRRVDRWSGQARYVYHGNDGTSYPWNDTAQLDYLKPEVREAVIRQILEVARRFPVIRFDAAMVLARRHIQRLWYPEPGKGGAIPSRAEFAMSRAEFERQMPTEFWREVVDRVAEEAPDTLLLAEAFWLLEGYFVRTLGMHRVYNSAFMHMLRDEDNAGYRKVIRETVRFDPRILGRYVNFMSNPDERTAIDQFGSGDKYFGVATVMATLPGLPMFGHGQLEGFHERYGMEFRRARLEEVPDSALVDRHEREIFPLLKERWRFATGDNFRLLDAQQADGSPDEDILAYANESRGARSLVVYRNRYAEGRVRLPGIPDALGIADDPDCWLILADQRSGLQLLRNAHDLHEQGLELDVRAYQCWLFLDPVEVAEGASSDWRRLAERLGTTPVPDVRAALEELLLDPVRSSVRNLIAAQLVRRVAGAAIARSGGEAQLDAVIAEVELGLAEVAEAAGRACGSSDASRQARSHLQALIEPGNKRLRTWLGSDRSRWGVLVMWVLADAIGSIGPGTRDGWDVDESVKRALGALGLGDEARVRATEVVLALVELPDDALTSAAEEIPTGWFELPAVKLASGLHEWRSEAYVVQERWDALVDAVAARDEVAGRVGGLATAAKLKQAAKAAGYRLTVGADRPDRETP
jgi:glycosidase